MTKRNAIGDSYVLGCSSGSLRRGRPATQEDDHALSMLASTPYNRYASALLDAQKGYAATPTIRNARSLLFLFHASGAARRRSRRALLAHGAAQTIVITSGYRLHALSS